MTPEIYYRAQKELFFKAGTRVLPTENFENMNLKEDKHNEESNQDSIRCQ